jgi:hypothetical protein
MGRAAHIDVQSARKGTRVIRISTMLRPTLGIRYRARFCAKERAFTIGLLNVSFLPPLGIAGRPPMRRHQAGCAGSGPDPLASGHANRAHKAELTTERLLQNLARLEARLVTGELASGPLAPEREPGKTA